MYSNGILLLSVFSGGLVWLFYGETHALIPLAIGVFLSFTLAQAGMMVLHWQERRPKYG